MSACLDLLRPSTPKAACLAAAMTLQRVGERYALEDQARELSSEKRGEFRKRHAQPRLEALHWWLVRTRAGLSPTG